MSKKILTLTLSSLLCTSLTSTVFSEELQTAPAEHIAVAERPMDETSRKLMKDQREELPADSEQSPAVEEKSLPNRLGARAPRMGEKKEYYFNNYQVNTPHWLISATYDGSIVEIEDGSHWKLAPNYSVFSWKVGDPIVVTPNHSCFSEYNYYVVNKFTGSYVAADLIVGPVAFGPYTHWIIGMDYASGHVFLENGTTWTVSINDTFIFNDWAVNDTVIIGSNDSWFSSYDSILINVNMNNFARSKQY